MIRQKRNLRNLIGSELWYYVGGNETDNPFLLQKNRDLFTFTGTLRRMDAQLKPYKVRVKEVYDDRQLNTGDEPSGYLLHCDVYSHYNKYVGEAWINPRSADLFQNFKELSMKNGIPIDNKRIRNWRKHLLVEITKRLEFIIHVSDDFNKEYNGSFSHSWDVDKLKIEEWKLTRIMTTLANFKYIDQPLSFELEKLPSFNIYDKIIYIMEEMKQVKSGEFEKYLEKLAEKLQPILNDFRNKQKENQHGNKATGPAPEPDDAHGVHDIGGALQAPQDGNREEVCPAENLPAVHGGGGAGDSVAREDEIHGECSSGVPEGNPDSE